MVGNVAWATDVTYTLTINGSDFNTTSYAANNNEKTSNAICTTDNTKTYEVKWTSNQVMKNGNNMQWQKNTGYIYNSTNLGTISSVTVNSSAGSFTTYYGTSAQPSSGTTVGNGYFKTSVGNATGTTSSVVVVFTISEGAIDNSTATTVTIDAAGITNTNKFVSTEAGTLTASVIYGSPAAAVPESSVTWSSSDEDVATVGETTGVVTLVGEGSTTITATYAGKAGEYKSSSAEYVLNVTNEDPDAIVVWSEDFTGYNADDVPSGGTYGYTCYDATTSITKIYDATMAGGTTPELLVSKSEGYFQAVVPLENMEGNMKLKFKKNNNPLTVSTSTEGISISGTSTFTDAGECTVTFTGVTTSMTSITIKFTTGSSNNVRIDDIVLRGTQVEVTHVATPEISPASGAIASGTEVTITCATIGASIYYTTDGSTPTSSSTAYNPANKPTITAATTIKAIAVKDGLTDSEVASAIYTIAAPCATPTFSVEEGEVEKGTTVTISTTTDDATIYYTIDGSTPTTSSSAYSSPIAINSNMTIKAIAIKDGMANSEMASATYTLINYTTLPFNWAGGTSSELAALTGVTTNGLGSDYAAGNAPYRVKMDGVGDYIQIKTNAQPIKVLIGIKMLGGATTSKIKVQESADGSVFNDVEELTISGSQNDVLNLKTSNSFATTTRYVKIIKSVHANGGNIGVGPIYIFSKNEVPLTITTAKYATFVTDQKVNFAGTGITAYTAKVNGNSVTLTSIEKVPANTPVVVYKDVAATTTFAIPVTTADIAEVSENDLCVSDGANAVGDNVYVLGNTNGIGFYKWTGASLSAGKVYLNVPAGSRDYLTFAFEDQATGVGASLMNNEKCKVNSAIFDLQGRRVVNPTKGLYIVNGKKVIVK